MLILNGVMLVQTFLVISGVLTTYLFLTQNENEEQSNVKIIFRNVLKRYIRLAPLQAIAILLQSTWLYRLGSGPIYNRVIYAEQAFCRKHWWKNMLFIDNYANVEEKCLIHTWYIDCDFWLNVFCVIFLVIIKM